MLKIVSESIEIPVCVHHG